MRRYRPAPPPQGGGAGMAPCIGTPRTQENPMKQVLAILAFPLLLAGSLAIAQSSLHPSVEAQASSRPLPQQRLIQTQAQEPIVQASYTPPSNTPPAAEEAGPGFDLGDFEAGEPVLAYNLA